MNGRNPQRVENDDEPLLKTLWELRLVVEARGGVPNFEYLCLLDKCQHLLRDARRELGYELGGFSTIDLLCDNTEEQSDVLELVLKDLGET